MATLTLATRAPASLINPALLVASYINESQVKAAGITVTYEDAEKVSSSADTAVEFKSAAGTVVYGTANAIKEIAIAFPILQGKYPELEAEWVEKLPTYSSLDFKQLDNDLLDLNTHLILRSYVVGYTLTAADLAVWGALKGNRVALGAMKKPGLVNFVRWYKFVEESNPWILSSLNAMNAVAKEKKLAKAKEGASYDIALLDTDKGVVTRFPPEPSGYLHIGHAKAALLNDFFAHEKYKGTLLCRFDDTNPTKEKEEFQDAIVEDLALMGIKPDKTSFTSDYFEELYQYGLQIIKQGDAYADDTEQEVMREERMNGIASKHRDASVAENLERFEEMKKGTEEGQRWCIRAKMSVDNPNKAMRDPVIYRCNATPHHRTGTTWKMYPTYDFCCPIVDSMENVTHALRTIEYRDRNPQYQWMLDTLKLRTVHIWDFARMNFVRTLLSKRKLTKFVEDGIVWGWDDPRFPTIRGIRRRGMTIAALREFILRQGPSRNIVNLDWTQFWATNKKYIDPTSPRHVAVYKTNLVKATITNGPAQPHSETKPKHNKNAELGNKQVTYSSTILFDQDDAKSFKEGEEITLMSWGNAYVRKISTSIIPFVDTVTALEIELHLEGDVKKTEKKVTWLAADTEDVTKNVPVELVDFDFLITKDKIEEGENVEDFLNTNTEFRVEAIADENVKDLKADDIIQFERKGFYRVDRAYGAATNKPAVLFNIPTGKSERPEKK